MKRIISLICLVGLTVLGTYVFRKMSSSPAQPLLFEVGGLLSDDQEAYVYESREMHRGYMNLYQHTDGVIAYLDRGPRDGRVIVLLHGTPTNSRLYRHIVTGLVNAGYRVIVPDMLGFGASTKTDNALLLSSRQQAVRLLDLLNSLAIETFVLGAHDQGTLRMRETVLRAPERVESLIIFNALVDKNSFAPMKGYGSPNLITKTIAWSMGHQQFGPIMTRIALKNGLVNKSLVTPTMREGYVLPLNAGADMTYYAFISSFGSMYALFDELADSPHITQKIRAMVVRGGQDSILLADEGIAALQKIFLVSERDVTVFDDAKHFIQEEKPFEIVEAIDGFLQRYTPPSKE